MLECGFESGLGLEFSGFSMWHFVKHVPRGLSCCQWVSSKQEGLGGGGGRRVEAAGERGSR